MKPKSVPHENSKSVKEIVSLDKRQIILNELRRVLKMEHCKISKLLNDSITLKFVTRKWIEVNDLSNGKYFINKDKRFKTPMIRSDLCH